MRVMLADDHELMRVSLARLLESEPDLAVVGQAGDGRAAVALAVETRPDLVLMDVRMPMLDGIEATAEICRDPALVSTRVLVLSMFDLDEYVYAALKAGASGFLLKDATPDRLLDGIRRVVGGESLLAPRLTERLITHFVSVPPQPAVPSDDRLTSREIDVLTLVGRGKTNGEIAAELGIGMSTVKTHVSHLLTKLDARDRVHLVIGAYEIGLVSPPAR